jgi:hypothetical protein
VKKHANEQLACTKLQHTTVFPSKASSNAATHNTVFTPGTTSLRKLHSWGGHSDSFNA